MRRRLHLRGHLRLSLCRAADLALVRHLPQHGDLLLEPDQLFHPLLLRFRLALLLPGGSLGLCGLPRPHLEPCVVGGLLVGASGHSFGRVAGRVLLLNRVADVLFQAEAQRLGSLLIQVSLRVLLLLLHGVDLHLVCADRAPRVLSGTISFRDFIRSGTSID